MTFSDGYTVHALDVKYVRLTIPHARVRKMPVPYVSPVKYIKVTDKPMLILYRR